MTDSVQELRSPALSFGHRQGTAKNRRRRPGECWESVRAQLRVNWGLPFCTSTPTSYMSASRRIDPNQCPPIGVSVSCVSLVRDGGRACWWFSWFLEREYRQHRVLDDELPATYANGGQLWMPAYNGSIVQHAPANCEGGQAGAQGNHVRQVSPPASPAPASWRRIELETSKPYRHAADHRKHRESCYRTAILGGMSVDETE
jgi:hypothetical protein